MYIYIYIYNIYIYTHTNMKKYKYIELYVEKHLCENIKEYIKNRNYNV